MRALLVIVAALAFPATAAAQTVGSVTVSESAGGGACEHHARGAARAEAVDVAWRTADATGIADAPLARAGIDYVAASGTVRFAPGGDRQGDRGSRVLADTVDDWGGFFSVVAGDSTGFIQILDDDPTPAPSIADTVVKENAGAVTLTVTRPAITERGFMRYAWTVKPGTAGVSAATGEITFAATDTVKTFTIPIPDDKTAEDDQTFTVELTPDPVPRLVRPRRPSHLRALWRR